MLETQPALNLLLLYDIEFEMKTFSVDYDILCFM